MLQFLRSFFSFVLNTQALYLITALPCMEPHPVRMESAIGGMESMHSIAWHHGSAVYGTAPCAHGIRHRRHGINA